MRDLKPWPPTVGAVLVAAGKSKRYAKSYGDMAAAHFDAALHRAGNRKALGAYRSACYFPKWQSETPCATTGTR